MADPEYFLSRIPVKMKQAESYAKEQYEENGYRSVFEALEGSTKKPKPAALEQKQGVTCLDFLIHVELRISAFRQTRWACDSPDCCAVARRCTRPASASSCPWRRPGCETNWGSNTRLAASRGSSPPRATGTSRLALAGPILILSGRQVAVDSLIPRL